MLSISNLNFYFGSRALYEGANLHIKPKNKIGLIGANGTGKSTLLRLIPCPTKTILPCFASPSSGNRRLYFYTCCNGRFIDPIAISRKKKWKVEKSFGPNNCKAQQSSNSSTHQANNLATWPYEPSGS